MDLEKIQSQLKSHIRQHQVLVQEMKKDPQNVEIQRKVQSLQAELTSLSEKQRHVVHQLKQNIRLKPKPNASEQNFTPTFPSNVMVGGYEGSPRRNSFQIQNSIIKPTAVKTMSVPRLMPQLAIGMNVGKNPAPNTSNVPNIHPPISPKFLTKISQNHVVHVKAEPVSVRPIFKKPTMVTTGMQTLPSLKIDTTRLKPILPRPEAAKPKVSMGIQTSKPVKEVIKDNTTEKLNFLGTLGLITLTKCKEINSQKHERKRRTSAIFSPYSSFQFFEPEPKKSATGLGLKRGRGRPPKNSDGSLKSPSSPLPNSPVFMPVNGFKIPNSDTLKNNKTPPDLSPSSSPSPKDEEHEDFCVVCQQSGEVLMCDTCILVYHLKCLTPPLTKIPPGMWMCPKCQETCKNKEPIEWPGTLDIAHSYLKHRAAQDKEREKLLSRNQELKLQELELQKKVNELSGAIVAQIQSKTEIVESTRQTQVKLQRLKKFIDTVHSW